MKKGSLSFCGEKVPKAVYRLFDPSNTNLLFPYQNVFCLHRWPEKVFLPEKNRKARRKIKNRKDRNGRWNESTYSHVKSFAELSALSPNSFLGGIVERHLDTSVDDPMIECPTKTLEMSTRANEEVEKNGGNFKMK